MDTHLIFPREDVSDECNYWTCATRVAMGDSPPLLKGQEEAGERGRTLKRKGRRPLAKLKPLPMVVQPLPLLLPSAECEITVDEARVEAREENVEVKEESIEVKEESIGSTASSEPLFCIEDVRGGADDAFSWDKEEESHFAACSEAPTGEEVC